MLIHTRCTPRKSFLPCNYIFLLVVVFSSYLFSAAPRTISDFGKGWKFNLGDIENGQNPALNDSRWRTLNIPHDWSIEGTFSKDNPAGPGGGALPGGIGWYRKTFQMPVSQKGNLVFIDFDGVYRNSEVWINGQYLGKRPYGYSSFRYELTPFLKYGKDKNIVAVKVDNSQQPNSRWYAGSGIYRNVWLVTTKNIYVDHWGTYCTTSEVTDQNADVAIRTTLRNASKKNQPITITTMIVGTNGKRVASNEHKITIAKNSTEVLEQILSIKNPTLWSTDAPYLYKVLTLLESNNILCDNYETPLGIRSFTFDGSNGFVLNGNRLKINGVCNHHDLGCLGAAVNKRALERQLRILKDMGVNGIRTSHNPPAPELLDLCDQMGFIVMDEAFDMWKKKKTDYDYSLSWDEWHKRDLEDMVLRDRNHPCVFVWSIGNEVMEQWDKKDTSGIIIAKELASIVKELDASRPITAACNDPIPDNPVIKSEALDLIGYNYHHEQFPEFPKTYPGKIFIGTETVSSLNTRGCYDMPSDSIRRWPIRWDIPFTTGNADFTCSSYDNCSTPWGSTHEETWKIMKKHDFLSGMYIWTGFDYLGEPTPYGWPARSSYFGIIDLAGFPKDIFYMYQSEWTKKPVLHIFPHWNWMQGDTIDVWAYTNCEEVELFLNGVSVGAQTKSGEKLHLLWRLPYSPGTLKAVGRIQGKEILTQEITTAGNPVKIVLEPDRTTISADGKDLSFITVKVVDAQGNPVPTADNKISFHVTGQGNNLAVDNGDPTCHALFKSNDLKLFNGLGLIVVQSTEKAGTISIKATSEGLKENSIVIKSKKYSR